MESRIVDVERRLVEMNGACTTFSYLFNAILSEILFLEPVFGGLFLGSGCKQGTSFMGMGDETCSC